MDFKNGWKSSRFWGKSGIQVIITAFMAAGMLDVVLGTKIIAVLEAIYTIMHTLEKEPEITTVVSK